MRKIISSTQLTIGKMTFACFLLSVMFEISFAQVQPTPVRKSEKTEMIEGKKFYIHPVEKGQTLYSIAKTYSTTVDIILTNNEEALDGLKAGDKLKIPFSGNTDIIKKEIDKQSTVVTTQLPKEVVSSPPPKETVPQKHEVPADKSAESTASPVQKKDSTGVIVAYTMKNEEDLSVALFLPLSLKGVEEINVQKISMGDEKMPDDVKVGIEFYEGAKIAFDSLKRMGFKGQLHVYDSNLDSLAFAKLLENPELKEMDLIIGPLHGKKFEEVQRLAKENNISIVAPSLSNNYILLGNPNVSKVTPSYSTQSEELAKYVSEKFAGQNIILFNSASPKDRPYLSTFKKTANPILQKSNSDTVKEMTFSTFANFISKTRPNIVVIPSANQSFVTEAVNKLFLDKQENNKDSIIVFGLSNFQDIESLDFGYLNALHAYNSTSAFVDYNNAKTKKFVLKYRNDYKTEPTQYVFTGFDVTLFYLGALQKYGRYLNKKLPDLKEKGIQTEFNFYMTDYGSGYENKGVGIMKFENFGYVRVK